MDVGVAQASPLRTTRLVAALHYICRDQAAPENNRTRAVCLASFF